MTSYIQISRLLRFYVVKNSEIMMSKTFHPELTMVTQITTTKKRNSSNNL